MFGAALHELDEAAYRVVFRPDEQDVSPGYMLRPCGHRVQGQALFELVLFDRALPYCEVVMRALQLAGERGLGRGRRPYQLARLAWLDAAGRPVQHRAQEVPFALDGCGWPLAGDPAETPCRVLLPEPARLLRKGALISAPTLRDLVVAGCRRLGSLTGRELREPLRQLQAAALEAADQTASQPFVGKSGSVGRWSASQHQHIELQGASGYLDLPDGPGPLWRLLAAMQWLHCGKATVVGLGRVVLTPIW
ncbi:MAG: CRISPR system precrRNA processing endoribonuclease RAMP protein Cas6 [Planctomycetes bacterium]|nr:CRISPR system precrRNA processing endoribonuclease RAMP protein Cas6 [Planctomycetota bacterium]